MQSIKKLKNLKNKKVIVRADFNVPIENGKVVDNFRIKKGIPTIKYLVDKGAKVLIITHLGKDGSSNLSPIISEFFKLSKIKKENVVFAPNIRAFLGEEKNETDLAKDLASLGDYYVNDAFSVSHRAHTSVVGIPKYLTSYAGFQLEEEIKNLSLVLKNKKHPFLFILGGAKFSTKMPLIKKYLKEADNVVISGALLNNFLKAKGYEVGKSLVDDEDYGVANLLKNKKIILATDVVVLRGKDLVNVKVEEIKKEDIIIDIGKESIKTLESYINKSKIILWNGPLGLYEKGGDKASKSILKSIAKSKALSIIGGGDTVALVNSLKLEDKLTSVSTGGGATLDFLAKGTLPGIKALK